MTELNDSVGFLAKYINQFEPDMRKLLVPPLSHKKRVRIIDENCEEVEEEEVEEKTKLWAFQKTADVEQPRHCVWDFMAKADLEKFLAVSNRGELREAIEKKIGKSKSGFCEIIAIEFLMDVTNFCRRSTFNIEQAGAILSIFYWAHRYFTSKLFVAPEDVYEYVRAFMGYHSLFFPPTHIKIFTIEEGKNVLIYFWRLYLRHSPLVRMLVLPNFGFELEYALEPDMETEKKKKGKKDKKKKDKKGKKGKKK